MATINRTTLASLLGLMGSAHDGEALSAARKAHSIVQQAGLTWADVLAGQTVGRVVDRPSQAVATKDGILTPPIGSTWRETLEMLVTRNAAADDYERRLLIDLSFEQSQADPIPFAPVKARIVTRIYLAWCEQEPTR